MHLIADVVCIFVYFPILMWATWCWCWWWLWEISKCLLSHTAPLPWPSPLTRVASLDTPPLSLSLAVGCAHWFPPSVGQHHFTPTGSLCGPGDRPNPPRPRSHQVTHIVRFATHPAQKSISELVRTPKRHFRPLKQLNIWLPLIVSHNLWQSLIVNAMFVLRLEWSQVAILSKATPSSLSSQFFWSPPRWRRWTDLMELSTKIWTVPR